MKKLYCIIVSLVFLYACSEESRNIVTDAPTVNKKFIACIEEPSDSFKTKTLLGGQSSDTFRSVLWQPNDEVYVTTGISFAKFCNTETVASKKATLEGSIAETGSYYAFYPYDMVSDYSSDKFVINLPLLQKYNVDGIDNGSFPMAAKSDNGVFNFKNICGILVLNLIGNEEISSISFSAKSATLEPMLVAGKGHVDISNAYPELVMSPSASTSVTLDCINYDSNGGVKLDLSHPTSFHLILPAGTYNTVYLDINTIDGKTIELIKKGNVTISRSQRTTTSVIEVSYKDATEPEMIDLGLSVCWASFNIGATEPSEKGEYYAWGEIYTKNNYGWGTYKYYGTPEMGSNQERVTKYCTDVRYGYNGFTDGKTILELSDDVAHVKLRGDWRMPTWGELKELKNNCIWTWTTMNGQVGYKVKSKISEHFIFLPAANSMYYSTHTYGPAGYYWSSEGECCNAHQLYFNSNSVDCGNSATRTSGFSIRAVCPKQSYVSVEGVSLNDTVLVLTEGAETMLSAIVSPSNSSNKSVTWSSSNTSVATVDDCGNVKAVKAVKAGSATITVTTDDGGYTAMCSVTVESNPSTTHEYVDLGLSVKWATCNVGATKPEEYGDYFAWGETEPYYAPGSAQSDNPLWKSGKSSGYNWSTYKYCKGSSSTMTKYCKGSNYGFNYGYNGYTDSKTVLDPEDDAAYVNWGGSWRMPTRAEQDELLNSSNCTWIWTALNGVFGCKVVSRVFGYAGNWIFLPAAGSRSGTNLSDAGYEGEYCSSSLFENNSNYACLFYFSTGSVRGTSSIGGRCLGLSVRPVWP